MSYTTKLCKRPLTPPADGVSCQRMGIKVTKKSKAEFAGKLKRWRIRENVSQSGAAEILRVPVRTLQNWEIARTKPTAFVERELMKTICPAKKRK